MGGGIVNIGGKTGVMRDMLKDILSGEVNFGNGVLIGGLDPASQTATIVQVKGSDERAIDLNVFISVLPDQVAAFTIADFPYVKARVSWGSGGVSHSAEIDVGLGTSFSVMASFLRVDVFLDTDNPSVLPAGNRVLVQGFVSAGRHIGEPAVRTLYFEVLAGATSGPQPIPAFARNVRIVGFNPTVNYRFLITDQQAQIVGSGTQVDGGPFILANDAKFIAVVNPGLAAGFMRAVFGVNL